MTALLDDALVELFVFGIPKPQPRPRAFARQMGSRFVARVYDDSSAEAWKGAVASAVRDHRPVSPFEGPIELGLTFYLPRPKAHYRTGKHAAELRPGAPRWHANKPDADNLAKSTVDALTILGFWRDDGQIAALTISKIWANPGEDSGMHLLVRRAE